MQQNTLDPPPAARWHLAGQARSEGRSHRLSDEALRELSDENEALGAVRTRLLVHTVARPLEVIRSRRDGGDEEHENFLLTCRCARDQLWLASHLSHSGGPLATTKPT